MSLHFCSTDAASYVNDAYTFALKELFIVTYDPYYGGVSYVACFVNGNDTGWTVITPVMINCTGID
jgi:hypothetical protein